MAQILPLREAVAQPVHDGDTVALEGFTHLIPHAAGQEIIRQRRKDLTLVRMTPDIVYDQLLEAEAEVRRMNEQVAAQRRALPAGGLLAEDYVFESAADGSEVRFSELFAPGKDTLVIYNMMFPRWSKDPRAGAPGGKTGLLPLVEQPCPSCTSVVDGLDGPAPHLSDRINLVAVAKTDPARLGTYAKERGWRNLRLLSSRNNTYNRDYHGETPEGEQLPVLNVFSRDEDGIHHRWASELMFARGDSSPLDPIWPIWGALDLTPNGRGDGAAYPSLQYE